MSEVPATKQDVALLMEQIGSHYDRTERRIEVLQEQLLAEWDTRQQLSEERIKLHFDAAVENVRHDLLGMHHDRVDLLQDRVKRLERHAGLQAA